MSRIITISREFGSGGRELGKRLANALGIPCYDHEIIEMIAKENGFNEDYVANVAEKSIEAAYPLTIGHRFGMQPFQIMDQPIRVAVTQRRILENFAKQGDCVIVGRCADYILEDLPNHLNVYIYAPDEARLKNCVENLQMDPQTAKKMMRDVDAARNRYHKAYIPGWQNVFDNQDLRNDSSRLGIDGTAKILADIVKNKWGD